MSGLIEFSKAKQRLDKSKDWVEVLDIKNQAQAAKDLLKARGVNLQIQNEAAEIKLIAERKLGQALKEMPKTRGRESLKSHTATLKDIGVTKTESSRWQKEASVPNDEFQEWVNNCNHSGSEITTAGLLRLSKKLELEQNREANKREREHAKNINCQSVVSDLGDLETGAFGTVYADPPWSYSNQKTRAATDNHYGTMSVDEICELDVGRISAKDSHLHLWTTNSFLRESFQVMDAWGFEYKSCFVWVKPQMGIGNYWRVSHEFLLLGVKGNAKRFNEKNHMSWLESARRKHSQKPEKVRAIIEKVSNGPYLEMFGRRVVDGWTVFGNQVEAGLF